MVCFSLACSSMAVLWFCVLVVLLALLLTWTFCFVKGSVIYVNILFCIRTWAMQPLYSCCCELRLCNVTTCNVFLQCILSMLWSPKSLGRHSIAATCHDTAPTVFRASHQSEPWNGAWAKMCRVWYWCWLRNNLMLCRVLLSRGVLLASQHIESRVFLLQRNPWCEQSIVVLSWWLSGVAWST